MKVQSERGRHRRSIPGSVTALRDSPAPEPILLIAEIVSALSSREASSSHAVKVIALRSSGAADPAGREVMSLTRLEANLRHRSPDLLIIHHVGKTADHLFYVMDCADDVTGAAPSTDPGYRPATLGSRLMLGPLGPEVALECTRRLLAGLASLHEAGMVHRDVKPSNCLFVKGDLKQLFCDHRSSLSALAGRTVRLRKAYQRPDTE